ncbi:MAG: pyrimidine 5'-nucleotidase [Deltaproteobacteria bacterium]|nr:pyrimidine 5'-nucleotidase [Deltaproteobacteria bacterium]
MTDVLIFDLDNTLYSRERDLFSLIDRRINLYMSDVLGIAKEAVDGLRRRYWSDYGVTLGGLIRHHGVDPEDYLDYVHDVDIAARLGQDPQLLQALVASPLRKVVFTNASSEYARRVLACLGVEACFDGIFDIRIASFLPKPYPEPYRKVLDRLGVAGERCVMVEDTLKNLKTAKELGMETVWVGPEGETPPFVDHRVASAAQVPAIY